MALVNRRGWKFQTGTTLEHDKSLPDGELSIDTDKKVVVTHDGTTVGGTPMAKESDLTDHEADTTNPHSVTKAQVGLTNVTDDAQLKRAAGDINSFTLKAAPVSADVVIIEDSADSYNKKKATVGTVGTTTFTGLTDTPANYTGAAGQVAKVNAGETALEFGAFVANPVTADVNFATYKAVAMACDNGTSFPATPSTGQWFYRTDICTLFIYEAAWNAIISFGAVTLYVDATNGSDAVGKGYASGAGACATIQYAVDLLPPINGGNIVINITGESYAETVTVQGKMFSGEYTLTLQGTLTEDDTGTASSATAYAMGSAGAGATLATMTDSSKAWTVNGYQNKLLEITGGTGYTATAGQEWKNFYVIDSNTDTVLTIVGRWKVVTPDATTTYAVKSWATVIDGGSTRDYCLLVNSQKGLISNNIYYKDALRENILVDNYSSFTMNNLQSESCDVAAAGIPAIQIQGFSTIKMRVANFFKTGSSVTRYSFMRMQNASAPTNEDSISGVKMDGNSKMSYGMIVSAISFVNNTMDSCIIRNTVTAGVAIGSMTRFDMNEVIIKSPGVNGILNAEYSYIIMRSRCEIDGATSHGIYATSSSLVYVVGSGHQSNNNGGYGAYADVQSFARNVSTTRITYTGNTSGTYAADAATFAIAT